jgi:DNA-binding response OmpR family regulator
MELAENRTEEVLVLLIEDDPDLSELAQAFLEQEGFVVVPARDGARALKLLQFITPDVVLTDLMMPVVDGFQFLKQYRDRADRPAPVIAMSALRPYVDKALEMGVAAAFTKPVDFKQVGAKIREVAAGEATAAATPPAPLVGEPDEAGRLRRIFELKLDEIAPEQSLRDFVDLVAAHFGVPIALISIVTDDRQFWTAGCGIPPDLSAARGTPRRESFCTHAVASRAALVVQDTRENPFFRDNPLARGHGVRFYAGVPLFGRHGEAVGTLCLLDYSPRTFTHLELELLAAFGRCVLAAFEQREYRESPEIPPSAFRYLEYLDEELGILGKAGFMDLAVVEGARASALHEELTCVAVAVPPRRLEEAIAKLRARQSFTLIGRLGHARLGWLVRGMTVERAREAALEAGGPHSFAEAVRLDLYPGEIPAALSQLEASLGDAGLV